MMSMVIPDMYVLKAEKGRLKNIDQKFLFTYLNSCLFATKYQEPYPISMGKLTQQK